MRILCLLALMLGVTLAAPRPAVAEDAESRCLAVRSADLSGLTGAPTRIVGADLAPANDKAPARCRVQGYAGPSVGFELSLPITGWNGKFAQSDSQFAHIGCQGADCGGALSRTSCDGPVRRGYACMVQDGGRRAPALDSAWARGNEHGALDFAFRATHMATLAGKAVTAAYYGEPPRRAYFLGCSAAGRQGLVSAQDFPDDYDGIVAGAPAVDFAGNALAVLWNVSALLGPDGRSLFPAPDGGYLQPDLRLLHKGVLAACDMNDGARDGIVGDPRACRFDPATLRCTGAKTPDCLTADQVTAIRKVFSGPVEAGGKPLFNARALPGSEVNWGYSYLSVEGGSARRSQMTRGLLEDYRLSGAAADPGPIDWDRAFHDIALQQALYKAANPDLRRFKAGGGKLIVFQGWSDHEVLPEGVIDYYDTVTRVMDGADRTRDFFRLFMIPGMDHCGNGASADKTDYLAALEAWVERGEAPDVLVVQRVKDARLWPTDSDYWDHPRWEPARIEFSRSIRPYPQPAH